MRSASLFVEILLVRGAGSGEEGALHRPRNPIRGEKSVVRFGSRLARFWHFGSLKPKSSLTDRDLSSCLQTNSSEKIVKRTGGVVCERRKCGVLIPSPFTSPQKSWERASGRSTQRPDIGALHGVGAASSLCARLFLREERFLDYSWRNHCCVEFTEKNWLMNLALKTSFRCQNLRH